MPRADDAGELTVRPAEPADIDVIARIHTAARSAYYRGFVSEDRLADPAAEEQRRDIYAERMADPECTVVCAGFGPEVAGFALLGPPHEPVPDPAAVGQLRQIHVRADLWRRGIGSALHRASVEAWRAALVTTARVDVWARNDRGRAFYDSHGWQPDGHRREGPAGFDFLRLVLAIPDGVNIADESREDER